ncbi:hypothetical protein GCM10027347_44830 [Larkinella harenae]
MGAKRIEIDWAKVDSMLRVMESGAAIARALGFNEETLYRACKREKKQLFQDYAQSIKAQTHYSLKAAQFKEAYGYEFTLTDEKSERQRDGSFRVVERKTRRVRQAPSVPMLIFLGKQYLGQTESSGNGNGGQGGEIPGWDIIGDEEEQPEQ